jgi:hypothetical protein
MKMFTSALCLLISISALAPSKSFGQSSSQDPVYLMAALGDSITAAFLANTSLSEKSRHEPPPGTDDEGFALWVYMRNLLENKKELSWVSGMEIPSHYGHLNRYIKKNKIQGTVMMYNGAVSGATLTDMVRQADKVVKHMQSGKFASLAYVTIMAGANDACNKRYKNGTPEQLMRRSLMAIFARLAKIRQQQPVRILVSGAPRIPDLGMPHIKNASTVGGMSCGYLQEKVLKACLPLTTWSTPAEYKERMARVARKNLAIRSAVQEANIRFPSLEIQYSDRMFEKPLKAEDLAIDCFHPNRYAHGVISTILWPEQPWYR